MRPTTMLPCSMNATPPNILRSLTPRTSASASRIRSAKPSSNAMPSLLRSGLGARAAQPARPDVREVDVRANRQIESELHGLRVLARPFLRELERADLALRV